jgi:hypothetical protein
MVFLARTTQFWHPSGVSDKPLDCIGLEIGAKVGKCDFREYATNTVETPATLSTFTLDKCLEAVRNLPPIENGPDHAAVGKDYLRFLQDTSAIPKVSPSSGMLSALFGMQIIEDEELLPDVCEFRN